MRRGPRHLLAAGVVLLALLVVGGLVVRYVTRGPLAGETYHDFGVVPVEGRTATVEHVFTLRNRMSQPIRIAETIPSCGCTTMSVSDRELDPGEPVELAVAFSVGNGTRKKSITLILDDGERERTQLVWVEATGRATETLAATRRRLPLPAREGPVGDAGPWATVTVRHETLDTVTPPSPEVEPDAGVDAAFDGWQRNGTTTNPVGWKGTLRMRRAAAVEPELPAGVTLRLGPQALRIQLTEPATPSTQSADAADAGG